jgi:hypothetical protein
MSHGMVRLKEEEKRRIKMKECPWFSEKINASGSCPFSLISDKCPWPEVGCDNHKLPDNKNKSKKEVKKE